MEDTKFNAIVLGVIYNPAEKKILIGRRENDKEMPNLTWCFPGGRLLPGDEVDEALKRKIKEKTGYNIKNLGSIFSNIYKEKKDLLATYFLTEVFTGEEKVGGDLVELKWVDPEELEGYFNTTFHSRLKEFLVHLK
ncbi:NUDIX hydrolase [archaeon]|jgi:8-oxo-dGTP diphosphatase|nr:NUDIX hydrolase [archaeon]